MNPTDQLAAQPSEIDERSSHAALRAIATFEALKGIGVFLLGCGLLSLLHKDVEAEAERFLIHLHVNPDRRMSHAILRAASGVTDGRIWIYAWGCVTYTVVRFTEAYGLWHSRVWAEWFALLSGSLYLPWEVLQVVEHPTGWHWALLGVNLIIICYMIYIRVVACKPPNCLTVPSNMQLRARTIFSGSKARDRATSSQ